MKGQLIGALVLSGMLSAPSPAQQNDTFATATVLPPGVLSVADELTQRVPDTRLGIRTRFGFIILSDDDNSNRGNEHASGLQGVPVETVDGAGSIHFVVTGTGDFGFNGGHVESGRFEVFLEVFDAADAFVDAFSEIRMLQPGVVREFSFSDPDWLGGRYNVNIDNTLDTNDVDFFTFTGLTPGTAFTAETLDPDGSDIDTYMGWFDDAGDLLASDDDGGEGWLSLIAGVVPPSGRLTFAVTGFGDTEFVGAHFERGQYVLQLTAELSRLAGDFNGDGVVDAADYPVWRDGLGTTHTLDHYREWKDNFGAAAAAGDAVGSSSHAAVPEPASLLLMSGAAVLLFRRKTTQLPWRDALAERR